jgi:predicted phage baseplate assembly protein
VSDGSANQQFYLGQTSVDPNSLQLQVDADGIGYADWKRTDDLGTAGINDKFFELDSEAGVVSFGDGVRGVVPAVTRRIRVAKMRAGGGVAGNLPAQTLASITVTGKPANLQVFQPVSTSGGADAESLADAERRIPAMLRHRDRAVTTEDYQTLAKTTPGASIGRVEVLPLFHPQTPQSTVPGVVSVMVLPQNNTLSPPNPRPDRALLQTVFAYLEPRKPLATELYVIGCEYRGIGLSVGISVRSGYGPDTVASQVAAALKNALWPLPPGGFTQTGYPLGRTVRALELQVIAASVPGVDEVTGISLFTYQNGVYSRVTKPTSVQAELALDRYVLPELLRVVVVTGDEGQTVPPPDSLEPEAGPQPDGTPIPLVPEVC